MNLTLIEFHTNLEYNLGMFTFSIRRNLKNLIGEPEVKRPLVDVGAIERIILKCISKKMYVTLSVYSFGTGQSSMENCCKHGLNHRIL